MIWVARVIEFALMVFIAIMISVACSIDRLFRGGE